MIPERLVEVVEDFDGEDLMGIREGFVGEVPVTPERKVDAVQAEHGLRVTCIGGHVRWIKLGSKDLE